MRKKTHHAILRQAKAHAYVQGARLCFNAWPLNNTPVVATAELPDYLSSQQVRSIFVDYTQLHEHLTRQEDQIEKWQDRTSEYAREVGELKRKAMHLRRTREFGHRLARARRAAVNAYRSAK